MQLLVSQEIEKTQPTLPHTFHLHCFFDLLQRIHFVPDPCTFVVNNVTIGLSSMDVLLHLGSEETVW